MRERTLPHIGLSWRHRFWNIGNSCILGRSTKDLLSLLLSKLHGWNLRIWVLTPHLLIGFILRRRSRLKHIFGLNNLDGLLTCQRRLLNLGISLRQRILTLHRLRLLLWRIWNCLPRTLHRRLPQSWLHLLLRSHHLGQFPPPIRHIIGQSSRCQCLHHTHGSFIPFTFSCGIHNSSSAWPLPLPPTVNSTSHPSHSGSYRSKCRKGGL